jgi:hypothetical protein
MSSPEQEEWDRVARAGAAATRKVLLRSVAAAIAFAIVFGGVFVGCGSAWGDHEAAEQADREARLARGETVYVVRPRGETKESRAAKQGFLLILFAAGAGTAAAIGAFVAFGGRLSPEHRRGLQRIR